MEAETKIARKKCKVRKRAFDSGTYDEDERLKNKKHRRVSSSHMETISQAEGSVDVNKMSWHGVRNKELLSDIMREDDREGYEEEEEEEDSEEEGVLAELHKGFVTLAIDVDGLRERCEGEDWKTGRWSLQEVSLLKRNIRSFIKHHQIVDIHAFIFDREQRYRRVDMFRYVAKGICRPLFAIYRKVARVFDAENYVGRWTEEMDKKLLELHPIHGNKWTKIGSALGVSGRSTMNRYRVICKTARKKGAWTAEEEKLLVAAVGEIRGEDWTGGDTELPETASWEDVAQRVNTRTALQCWKKWVHTQSWKEDGVRLLWTLSDDAALIESVSRMNVLEAEDEEEVDWTLLGREWPHLAQSNTNTRVRDLLRSKWNILKRSVPFYLARTFQENLDYLVQHRLPALKHRSNV